MGDIYNKAPKVFQDDEYGISLYQEDCFNLMDQLIAIHPNGLFDMIFADPPYFLSNNGITCQGGKMVKVNKGSWDKSKGIIDDHQFNSSWLSKCQTLLKPEGTIWVSGTHHNIYSIGYAMQQLGFKLLNNITWEKPNPPPNLSCRYFTHSTETIIWASKNDQSKHVFHYPKMKEINGGKQMKSVWTMKTPSKQEKIFGKHPTQKPLDLLIRIIEASSNPENLIFDPFSGSSTTGVACIRTHRKFIGCELDAEFLDISQKRLLKAINSMKQQ